MSAPPLSRRDWLRLTAAGALGTSLSGWLPALAADAAAHPQRRRSCILLWMDGGPATIDLWDLKPGHANGGPFKEIATAAPGLGIGDPVGAGFLGPQFAPLGVGPDGRVANLDRPAGVSAEQFDARMALLADLDRDFTAGRPGPAAAAHAVVYERATRLMRT